MKPEIELLAPGGDIDSIKAAIAAGADAVYCGLNRFNARNRAANLEFDALKGVIRLAHDHGCKVFLTLNILIMGAEFPALIRLLNKLINTRIDAVIVQDLGLLYILSTYYPGLDIHASTQLNTHNPGQTRFLSRLGVGRANLSRELNIQEIRALSLGCADYMSTEVFVHGSYCIGFSGLCYMSSVLGGNSGNRGRCSQPCRDKYQTTPAGKNFPLNLKDNSAYEDLEILSAAGVGSLKIEGRIKQFDYVYTVVNCWRKQLHSFYTQNRMNADKQELYKVFNRDFSNAYLQGKIHKDMFIDNPRDHSIRQFSGIPDSGPDEKLIRDKIAYYGDKEKTSTRVKEIISSMSIEKRPLTISISGRENSPLTLTLSTPDRTFKVMSRQILVKKNKGTIAKCLTHDFLWERLSIVNETQYYLSQLDLDTLDPDLFISFNEITAIRDRVFIRLNGSGQIIAPIELPFLKKPAPLASPPALSVLIDSKADLPLVSQISGDIFFQLPNGLDHDLEEWIDFFTRNPRLIAWFPAVLIGRHYTAAKRLMEQTRPRLILTNNTGIANEAYEKSIPWLAGPYMNLVNSFGLLCLKERFNCQGGFISGELSKFQIKRIIRPKDFKLYASIYHPILLLSSRQCLLHQVTGCPKETMDETCIQTCSKSSSITNLNGVPLLIKKTRGNYHCLYHPHNYLNTDIVTDVPNIFSSFSIDLRQIETHTQIQRDKAKMINRFEGLLKGDPESKETLEQMIYPTTRTQYKKGI